MSPRGDKNKTIELAEKYVKAGKLAEAIAEYEKLLEGDVQDINIINVIGDLQVRLGENEVAIRSFQRVAGYYEKKGQPSQALAIYKKITKLAPSNPDFIVKLADLYSTQGFYTEASAGYLQIADKLRKEGRTKDAIPLYEKLAKMNRENSSIRLALADLYKAEGMIDQAVEEMNDAAEYKFAQGDLVEAEKILLQAKELKEVNIRTVSNLVEIYKKQNKTTEAIEFAEETLRLEKDNLQLLNLLGSLYFESKNFVRAEEVLAKIIEERPLDVRARIKLGRIHIFKEELDKAYELFEPLVANLLKKQREEKAIGLLGLILSSKKIHLPTLEKLASIYKATDQKGNLEVVSRVILEETRALNKREKMLAVLAELAALCPDDEKIIREYKALRKEFGLADDKKLEEFVPLTDDDEKIIRTNLAQADLYIDQGLVRNARRILEHLQMRYVDDARVAEKLAFLDEIQTKVGDEELALRIERLSAREAKILEKQAKLSQVTPPPFAAEGGEEPKIIAADIFAETDIVPFPVFAAGERQYYDLRGQVDEELKMINEIFSQQAKGTTIFEKELGDIVQQFRKDVGEKINEDDSEIHFYLGVAFMEQGLLDEAIEELKIASKDSEREIECTSVIASCFRQKKEYTEAVKWIEKALKLARKRSAQAFALKFDLATLYEELKIGEKALALYKDVQKWDPEYRDVSMKIGKLENPSAPKSL